jgi:hypothetical protein
MKFRALALVAGRPIPSPGTPITRQLRPLAQARSDRILPNVCVVVFVVLCVANAVIYETCLPYFKSEMNFPFRTIGETALDELQWLFQRDFRCRCQQQMEVIGRDHKFVQQKPLLATILRKNIHQKLRHAIGLEKRAAPGCRRGYEKRTGLIGQLGAFSPGLKPGHGKIKRFRGFENPRPRTEVRGWHGLGSDFALIKLEPATKMVPSPGL